jgi:hypothetical protein
MQRAVAVIVAVAACSQPAPPEPPGPRFAPLLSPSGVPDVETVLDEVIDRPDRVAVEVRLLAPKGLRYAQLQWLLESVHRQAAGRRGFQNARRPRGVDIRVYDDRDAARDATRYLARVRSEGGDPVTEIRIPFPLGEEVGKMIAARPDFAKIRPTAEADDTAGRLTVRVPYVDGPTDEYLPRLGRARALEEWSSWTLDLFDKYPALSDFTFVGEYKGTDVVRVEVTRAQLGEIGLRQAEEDLGAYQGDLRPHLMSGKLSEADLARKVEARRLKAYADLLAHLPRAQVSIAPSLR